jgi:hypothetical protein
MQLGTQYLVFCLRSLRSFAANPFLVAVGLAVLICGSYLRQFRSWATGLLLAEIRGTAAACTVLAGG